MSEDTNDKVFVYFETRISTLLPKGKHNSHNAFKEIGKEDDVLSPWRCCYIKKDANKKDTGEIKIFNSGDYDSLIDEDKNEFSDYWANIYRDHCIYWGNESCGYFRIRERIVKVTGLMFDFDSHNLIDMPIEEIDKIVMSDKFQALPFDKILFSGNGYQVHFKISKIITDENRESSLKEIDQCYQCMVQYFITEFGLKPDMSCTDPNRLHRRENSFNTKRCENLLDKDSRIKVKLIKEKKPTAEEVRLFTIKIIDKYYKFVPEKKPTERTSLPSSSPLDLKNIENALTFIDPDSLTPSGKDNSEYSTWAFFGAAIKLSYPGDDGFRVWDNWSKRGAKYNEFEMTDKWDSFKRTGEGTDVVTVASIFKEAKENGWIEPVNTDLVNISNASNTSGSAFETDTMGGRKSEQPISHKDLMSTQFNSIEWIAQDIISKHSVTMIFGKEKIGKSYWVLSFAYGISSGDFIFGSVKTVKTDVLYLALEDTKRRLYYRIKDFEKNKPELTHKDRNLYYATRESGVEDMDGEFFNYIDEFLKEHKVELIIIDTIVRVQNKPSIKKDAYQNSSSVVIKLQHYAMTRGVSIIFVHHECKNNRGGDVFDSASGGKGYGAQVDTEIRLERPHMNPMGTLSIRGREMEDKVYNMEFRNCDWYMVEDKPDMSGITERESDVITAIQKGNEKLKDIETFLDCDSKTNIGYQNLKKIVSRLYKKNIIGKSDRGRYYLIKEPSKEKIDDL